MKEVFEWPEDIRATDFPWKQFKEEVRENETKKA